MRSSIFLRLSLFAVCASLLIGCSPSTSSLSSSVKTVQIAGKLHGGQQPVVGATIQVYEVGTTGDASAATPLLTPAVTTASDGSFSLAGASCHSSSALAYLVATSGNPGFSNGANNNALAMMAALGPCGQIGPNTFIYVNELTTVGSIAALYPYASSYANIGSGAPDAAQLTSAFTAVSEYTNTTNGTVPGPTLPSGFYASSTEIATLANILASCINSPGGTSNDGSPCGYLFSLAQPSGQPAPTDTIGAIIDILKYPNPANVAALYTRSPAVAPFQPSLTSAPADWTLPILAIPATPTFSLASGPYSQAQSLTIADATSGAAVYYTLDGSTPTIASSPYSGGSIPIATTTVIKAIAVTGGKAISPVASATYTIASGSPSMIAIAGSNQSTPAVADFTVPLQVLVLDAASHATAGVTVTFAAPVYGITANLSATTCVTDNSGQCSVFATAGPLVGGPYAVNATAGALSTSFSLTNTTQPGSHNFVVQAGTDASQNAANCVDQSSGSTATNVYCSIRDAVTAASQVATASAPATIRFARTEPTQIYLETSNRLNLPSYTTLQGATTGSGATLTNLITLNGNYNSGITVSQNVGTVINNITVVQGSTGLSMYGGSLTINNSTFAYNGSSAITNNAGTLTINNSTFNANSGANGGAIDNFGSGVLNVSNSTFTANSASTDGGAIYTLGPATIINSTIAGNSASGSGSPGGGIYNLATGTTVTNSIISNNTGGDCGGAFCGVNWYYVNFDYANGLSAAVDSGSITLAFSDSVGNTFSQTAAAGQFSSPASLASTIGPYFYSNHSGLDTTFITGQSFANLLIVTPANGATLNPFTITNTGQSFNVTQVIRPFLLLSGHNVFGVTSPQSNFFNLTSANAVLGPLANNGGPTQTMLPLAGSAALCAISPSTATGADQRGQPRVVTVNGTTCQDAGAVQTAQ